MRTIRLTMAVGLLAFGQRGEAQTSALRAPASLAAPSVAPQAPQATQLRGSMFGSSSSAAASGASPALPLGAINRVGTSPTTQNAGASFLQGNERFLRRNRRAGMFVGSDAQDARTLGGMQPSTTTEQVAPAVGPVSRSPAGAVAPEAGVGRDQRAYPPRLTIGFDVPEPSTASLSEVVTRQLTTLPGLHPANRIEVSVAGRVATLTGVVASARDRALIESLILFEPGIAVVRNDLQVQPPVPPAPRPLDAPPIPPPPATPAETPAPQ